MRWKSLSQISINNERKICHLIRAAQSAAHLPLEGKAVKMSAEIIMEHGLLLWGSEAARRQGKQEYSYAKKLDETTRYSVKYTLYFGKYCFRERNGHFYGEEDKLRK